MVGGQGASARLDRYRSWTVVPVREVRAELPDEAVPYDVRGREVRVNPRLLSYWIPFVAGVGLMIGGMKTAVVPLVSVPQLVLGVALIATAAWDFVTDSGRLDTWSPRPGPAHRPPPPPPPAPPAPPAAVVDEAAPVRRTYDEKFRRHAVNMVRSTGEPVAAIARELGVHPSTLAGWLRKDRAERQRFGIIDPPDLTSSPAGPAGTGASGEGVA